MAAGAASAHDDATAKATEPTNETAQRPDQRRPPTTHPSREKLFLEVMRLGDAMHKAS